MNLIVTPIYGFVESPTFMYIANNHARPDLYLEYAPVFWQNTRTRMDVLRPVWIRVI